MNLIPAAAFLFLPEVLPWTCQHRLKFLHRSTSSPTRSFTVSTPPTAPSLIVYSSTGDDLLPGFLDLPVVPLLLSMIALILGVVSQGWINRQLQGDRGLGAFLQDGRGYANSSFRPVKADDERALSSDPLPWLKLPRLDFVEVAGQKTRQQELMEQLEELRVEMHNMYEQGRREEAGAAKLRLEKIMRENGLEYLVDDSP